MLKQTFVILETIWLSRCLIKKAAFLTPQKLLFCEMNYILHQSTQYRYILKLSTQCRKFKLPQWQAVRHILLNSAYIKVLFIKVSIENTRSYVSIQRQDVLCTGTYTVRLLTHVLCKPTLFFSTHTQTPCPPLFK